MPGLLGGVAVSRRLALELGVLAIAGAVVLTVRAQRPPEGEQRPSIPEALRLLQSTAHRLRALTDRGRPAALLAIAGGALLVVATFGHRWGMR